MSGISADGTTGSSSLTVLPCLAFARPLFLPSQIKKLRELIEQHGMSPTVLQARRNVARHRLSTVDKNGALGIGTMV